MRYLTIFGLALMFSSCGDMMSSDEPEVSPQQRIDSAEQCNADFKAAIDADLITDAMDAANRQIAISERIQYSKGIADGHANKGQACYLHSMYAEAIQELTTAQSNYELMNNDSGKAKCLARMSIVYTSEGNYDQALNYGELALELHKTMNDQDEISRDMNNLGQLNMMLGKYTVAKAMFAQRVGMERSNGDSAKVARALTDIGNAYTESGDAAQGLDYHRQALNALEGLDINSDPMLQRSLIAIKLSMSGEHFLQNDYAEAIRAGEDALGLSRQSRDQELTALAYKQLAEIYGLTGREDIQLQYLESYTLINDSLRTQEMAQKWAELQAKYETIKVQSDLEAQEAEIDKLKLEQQNSFLFIAFVISAILAALFFVALIIIAISKARTRRSNVY